MQLIFFFAQISSLHCFYLYISLPRWQLSCIRRRWRQVKNVDLLIKSTLFLSNYFSALLYEYIWYTIYTIRYTMSIMRNNPPAVWQTTVADKLLIWCNPNQTTFLFPYSKMPTMPIKVLFTQICFGISVIFLTNNVPDIQYNVTFFDSLYNNLIKVCNITFNMFVESFIDVLVTLLVVLWDNGKFWVSCITSLKQT